MHLRRCSTRTRKSTVLRRAARYRPLVPHRAVRAPGGHARRHKTMAPELHASVRDARALVWSRCRGPVRGCRSGMSSVPAQRGNPERVGAGRQNPRTRQRLRLAFPLRHWRPPASRPRDMPQRPLKSANRGSLVGFFPQAPGPLTSLVASVYPNLTLYRQHVSTRQRAPWA